MSRFFRVLLTWFMVIAIPAQGVAASAMQMCGPSHERMMQGLVLDVSASALGHAGSQTHVKSATDHGPHEHAASGAPVLSEPTSGADGDGLWSPFPHHGKFTCSACAACCFALAPPASFEWPEAVRLEHIVRSSPLAPVVSHQPDGLDRPPRAVFA
jgi:hypothetical protein